MLGIALSSVVKDRDPRSCLRDREGTAFTHVQLSDEWFDLRKGTISASKLAGLIGLDDKYNTSRNKAWRIQAGLDKAKPFDSFALRHMARGRELEPRTRLWFAKTFNLIAVEAGAFVGEKLAEDVTSVKPHLLASPDGLVYVPWLKELFVLEIKSPQMFGDNWDEPPLAYIVQIYCQMHCTGLRQAFLVARVEESDEQPEGSRVWHIRWDDTFGAEMLLRCKELMYSLEYGLEPPKREVGKGAAIARWKEHLKQGSVRLVFRR